MLLPQLLKQEGLVMVMLMMAPDSSEGHTTCTAITTVYNTSVTCLFAEDISQLGFNVQFFFPNTSVDPEMLLVCNRLTSGGLTCHKGSQVLFDEKQKIADRFTLSRPPSLNKLNRGYYQCHAVPSLTERSQFCPLTYQNVPTLVPQESLPPPPKDGNYVIHVFMLVAIVIILILLIVMISARFCLWAKRNSVALWCSRRVAEKERAAGVENAKESIPLTGLKTRIPEGAQEYYNMGWREALKDETIRMRAAEPSPAKSVESPTRPPIQHDKRDPQVEGEERKAAVDLHQPSRQFSQGAARPTKGRRDKSEARWKTTVVSSPSQRGQDCPAQQLKRQSSQPTLIAGEGKSSEIQTEVAEEATPMMWGGSDTSEHGTRDESKEENTRAVKTSKDESGRGETSGGQEGHGGEGEVDIKVKENPTQLKTTATGKKQCLYKPWTWFK